MLLSWNDNERFSPKIWWNKDFPLPGDESCMSSDIVCKRPLLYNSWIHKGFSNYLKCWKLLKTFWTYSYDDEQLLIGLMRTAGVICVHSASDASLNFYSQKASQTIKPSPEIKHEFTVLVKLLVRLDALWRKSWSWFWPLVAPGEMFLRAAWSFGCTLQKCTRTLSAVWYFSWRSEGVSWWTGLTSTGGKAKT